MSFSPENPRPLSLLNRARAFRTKKSLGQNFLVSEEYLQKITEAISAQEGEQILEIGPGLGFLTERLAAGGAEITAIDLDKAALGNLKLGDNVKLLWADALHFDFETVPKPFKVVGNLPFNVGTQILLRLVGDLEEQSWKVAGVSEMVLMFQLEVAQRLVAKPGSKAYNPLSILVNAKCESEFLFKVPANCFFPIPKVEAGVIRLKARQNNPFQDLSELERKNLKLILKQAFSTRRKTLKNSLAGLFSGEELTSLNISPQLRAESLSLSEYIALAKNFSEARPKAF